MTNIFIAFVTSVAAIANLMPAAFPALPTQETNPSTEVTVTESAKTVVATAAKPVETKTEMPKKGRIVTVTAYTSERGQTDSTPCTSADGSDICVKYAGGEKICATNDHPMHSKLFIQGYGECTVRDRMNTRYTGTGRVDIYLGMDKHSALQWGARHVQVAQL